MPSLAIRLSTDGQPAHLHHSPPVAIQPPIRCKGKRRAETNAHRIEVAVKQILSGLPVKTNASVANPEALEWFKAWAAAN